MFWGRAAWFAACLYLGIAQRKQPAGQGQALAALADVHMAATHEPVVEPAGNDADLADSAAATPATDRYAPLSLALHGAQQRFAGPHVNHFATNLLEDAMKPAHGLSRAPWPAAYTSADGSRLRTLPRSASRSAQDSAAEVMMSRLPA